MGTLLQYLERIMIKTNDQGKTSYKSDYEDRDVRVDPKTKEPRETWKPGRLKYWKHDSQRKFKSPGELKVAGHKGKITRLVNGIMGKHIKGSLGNVPSRTSFDKEARANSQADFDYVRSLNRKRYGAPE